MFRPMALMVMLVLTGSRSDLSLKLFGNNIEMLIDKAAELERVVWEIPGCADLSVEQVFGQPILQVKLKQ